MEGGEGADETAGDGQDTADRSQGLKSEHGGRRGRGEVDASGRVQSSACSPGRLSVVCSLKVMNNELGIDDGHPLALELQSLRGTVAKYQVSLLTS